MYEVDNGTHSPVFANPAQYVAAKLKILNRDFYI